MAVTTSFVFTPTADLRNDFEANGDVTALSGGGFMTAGDDKIDATDIDLRPYSDSGAAGAYALGSAGGTGVSIDQLSSHPFLGGQGNVVTAFQSGSTVRFSIVGPTGTQVTAPAALAGADLSDPEVLGLAGRFTGGGALTWQNGGFVVAVEDLFAAGDSNIKLHFYNNAGVSSGAAVLVSNAGGIETGPSMAQTGNGNIAVAWTREVGSNTEIRYAVYNRDGSTTVRGQAVLDNIGEQNRDVAVVATDGGFALFYEEVNGSGLSATRTIKMVTLDAGGTVTGSRVVVSGSGIAGSRFDDIAVTRMPDGFLALAYTVSSGFAVFPATPDKDVVVRILSQDASDPFLSAPYEVTGAGSTVNDATNAAIEAFSNGQLAVIYDEEGAGTQGEVLRLTRVHTGDAANDVMTGSLYAESFVGGAGADTVDYSGQSAALTIDLAANTATGGFAAGDRFSGIENLLGGNGADTLTGNAAANRLAGNGGNDTLAGGGGRDRLEGGAGSDRLLGGGGADRLFGGADADTLFGGGGRDNLQGGGGQDEISGGAGGDAIGGGGGADRLFGGGGNDRISGGGGADRIEGGGGNDVLNGVAGQDTILGGAGRDTLAGGGGNDSLDGGTGIDVLFGGAGGDILSGGAGNDTLTGGGGSDVFVFGPGQGRDTVTDFQNGADLVQLTGGLTFADVTETAIAGGVRLTFDGEPGLVLTLMGVTAAQIGAEDFL